MNAIAIPPFRIDYRREEGLLRARVTGAHGGLEGSLAYWGEIAAEVRRQCPRALLVVNEMEGEPLPPEQAGPFVRSMLGKGLEGLRMAYVEAHSQQIPKVEHAEIAAREAGFDVRVFGDEDAARSWLRHGAVQASGLGGTTAPARALGGEARDGCDIAFRQEGGSIVAEVSGWIDEIDALVDLFRQGASQLRKARCDRLLVIDRTRGVVPPEAEMRRMLAALEGSGLDCARIAWVDVRGTAVGRIEVAEILGRERGYDVQVFDNEQRARIWLDYGQS